MPYTTPATSSAPTPATASTTNASSAPNNYFPQQTMTSYEGGNLAGLVQKLGEFNAVVPSPLSPEGISSFSFLFCLFVLFVKWY